MAGIDLTTAQEMLDTWVAAEKAVAKGQSYSIGGRSLTRANLREIGERIKIWSDQVEKLTASSGRSGMRVRGITPMG